MARLLLVWVVLFAAYCATIGLTAFGESEYGGDEPHYLLTAESIVSDGDVDLRDEYRTRAYADWYPLELEVHGHPTGGRLHEPHGLGFAAAIAPAYALAGPRGVEAFLAAVGALAFVLAAALARRLVPEPWATAGPLACGLAPPALAYGTAVYPELPAGAVLAGAALLAVQARERPRVRGAAAAAGLLALLPWLGPKFVLPGAVVAGVLVRWLLRRNRRFAALLAGEVMLTSLVAYAAVNLTLFDGLTPYAAEGDGDAATGAAFPGGYVERLPRLAALWLDRDYGLLRWAPIFLMAFFALWLLWRSRRERVARALPEQIDVEVIAGMLCLVAAAQVAVAAFLAPTMFGFWFPGRHLVAALPIAAALVAWGLRHAPRAGGALAAVTLAGSAWLYAELRLGDGRWVASDSSAPWGPLEAVWPLYGAESAASRAWATGATAVVVTALALLALREWRHWRQTAGATRRAYSG